MSEHTWEWATRARLKKIALLVALDILSVFTSLFAGLWIRFDFSFAEIPTEYLQRFVPFGVVFCLLAVAVFALWRLYHSIWLFASVDELFRIVGAYVTLGVGCGVYLLFNRMVPLSVYLIGFVLSFLCTVAIRFTYRIARELLT